MNPDKSGSRNRKLVLVFAFVGLAILSLVFFLPFIGGAMSPYRQFARQSTNYYSEIARACDAILQRHPMETNEVISLSTEDAAVPEIIRDLKPTKIKIEPNRVWIGVGETRPGFGIIWEPAHVPNTWTLTTYADGLERTFYSETKQ